MHALSWVRIATIGTRRRVTRIASLAATVVAMSTPLPAAAAGWEVRLVNDGEITATFTLTWTYNNFTFAGSDVRVYAPGAPGLRDRTVCDHHRSGHRPRHDQRSVHGRRHVRCGERACRSPGAAVLAVVRGGAGGAGRLEPSPAHWSELVANLVGLPRQRHLPAVQHPLQVLLLECGIA